MTRAVAVGDRVEALDGARGRVRWVGVVDGRDGEWIGIQWDDGGRGKHDGVVDGKRYFTCAYDDEESRVGDTRDEDRSRDASLVRAHKIAPGRTFVEAFRDRYARVTDDFGGAESCEDGARDMYIRTTRGLKMRVQLCETEEDMELDEEGMRLRLKSMTRAYVDNARVDTMGEKGEASANAGSLRVLGLAGSLLNSWDDVLRIAEEFSGLEALDLSGIRLESWPKERPSGVVFQNLRVFVLNNARVKWRDVCALGAYMPKLEELYLNGNRIARFDSPRRSDGETVCFPNLRVLSVEENAIDDWFEIEALGRQLPLLEKLYVSQNKIREIASTGALANLKTLLLGDNGVDDWTSINALNSFPRLEEVRLTGNPFTSGSADRYEIIARVAKLKMLNGSTVSVNERKDSEIRYLRRVLQKIKECSIDEDARSAVKDANPLVDDLVAKHGDLVTHAVVAPGVATFGAACVHLHLTLKRTGKALTRRLPKTITIRRLRFLCAKLFDVPVDTADLFLFGDDDGVELEPDDEPLDRFDPRDGHRVVLVTRDV